jgi:hypothetical protein
MIDIVTVVFKEELPVLKLQAQSIALYCRNIGIRNIYVVLNDTETLAQQIDPAWWGELASSVLIVPRSTFSTEFVDNGWVSQQVLKILAAGMSYNTWSMVLDAKTIFVRDVKLSELIDSDGRMRVGSMPVYPVFEPSRLIVNELYNIDLDSQLGPGGVPFFFQNDAVRLMIAETTFLAKKTFPRWFQIRGKVTEFILYSGYLKYRFGGFDVFYSPERAVYPCNICHSEVNSFDRKMQEMKNPQTLTVSIHRSAWGQLSTDQQEQYKTYLMNKNITQAQQL